jgi:hypothetical protein
MIAVDQNALGEQGRRVVMNGDGAAWVKTLKGRNRSVAPHGVVMISFRP